jgi:hypothetical protein
MQFATGVGTSGESRLTSLRLGSGAMTAQWANRLWLSMATLSAYLGRVTLILRLSHSPYTMGNQYFQALALVGTWIVATLNTSRSPRLHLK